MVIVCMMCDVCTLNPKPGYGGHHKIMLLGFLEAVCAFYKILYIFFFSIYY